MVKKRFALSLFTHTHRERESHLCVCICSSLLRTAHWRNLTTSKHFKFNIKSKYKAFIKWNYASRWILWKLAGIGKNCRFSAKFSGLCCSHLRLLSLPRSLWRWRSTRTVSCCWRGLKERHIRKLLSAIWRFVVIVVLAIIRLNCKHSYICIVMCACQKLTDLFLFLPVFCVIFALLSL